MDTPRDEVVHARELMTSHPTSRSFVSTTGTRVEGRASAWVREATPYFDAKYRSASSSGR